MIPEGLPLLVAAVVVLGISAQWLAWRFRLPSILLLLLFGILAGPVGGLLDPEMLSGDWLFLFVSFSVAIILFEGGLSLRMDELSDVGNAIRNLITVGVAVTGVLATLGAHYLAGFSWNVAMIVGALLTVTGPTVVIPLLRHVRPVGRIGTVAKWEGITVDPVGAILAVLVLESVVLLQESIAEGAAGDMSGVLMHLAEGLLLEIVVGLGMAALGAGALVLLFRRRMVPDHLQNSITLMMVLATFALANALQDEAGLLEVTLMGIIMANQKSVSIRRLLDFKEDLRVLLISLLFIVLAARLQPSDIAYVSTGTLLFVGFLMLVVRPLAVALSSIGTRLAWKEQVFLAWLAPRGIVAASVASLFSFRLEPFFPADAAAIVPVVFLVIISTVAVYGLTITPLARWLGLALPDPQGLVFLGAHPWARALARAVQRYGFRVLVLDANAKNVREARQLGLEARRANILSEGIMDELDLSGTGRFLALTPNDEVNALAALHFSETFESADVYQVGTRAFVEGPGEIPLHLRGQPLFSPASTYTSLTDRFDAGACMVGVTMTREFDMSRFRQHFTDATAMLVVR
jgi:NhaP-type Na+/H+ or K+/H+ antiporter